MQLATTHNKQAITRLTALWALCECGLGGWMHAVKTGLTGFLIGGAAVVIITLIAHFSQNKLRDIARATVLVLLVKAAVSPHSPPPAYIAVAFQGFLGAVLFGSIVYYRLAAVVLGMLAMVESAAQTLAIKTLIYGMALWEAIDILFAKILEQWHLPADTSFSYWLIVLYLSLYALWGLILGLWASSLSPKLQADAARILTNLKAQTSLTQLRNGKTNPFTRRVLRFFLLLTLIVISFLLGNYSGNKVVYIILRSIAVTLFLFAVVNPLATWVIKKWLAGRRSSNASALADVMVEMTSLRVYVQPAWAASSKKGLFRLPLFLYILIIISLYQLPNE